MSREIYNPEGLLKRAQRKAMMRINLIHLAVKINGRDNQGVVANRNFYH